MNVGVRQGGLASKSAGPGELLDARYVGHRSGHNLGTNKLQGGHYRGVSQQTSQNVCVCGHKLGTGEVTGWTL